VVMFVVSPVNGPSLSRLLATTPRGASPPAAYRSARTIRIGISTVTTASQSKIRGHGGWARFAGDCGCVRGQREMGGGSVAW